MSDKSMAEDIMQTAHFLVLPYVGKYSLSPENAEDLESECIIKVYSAIAKYSPEKGQVSTFAKKIIKDTVHNWETRLSITNEIFTPMTEEIENAHMNVPEEISDADEFKNATKEIIRNTVQTLCEEARQFFEDFFNLEKLMNKKPTLNALRKYYNSKGISMGRRQFYELLWPKMLDKFNDAFYVACKDDPDILAWFLRKFLEGQRREDDKKRFIKNNKKGN